jgi:hypothetical protein
MMLYGQFNVFPRNRGFEILKQARAALKPGGSLLLEIQSAEQIQRAGETGPSWYSARAGLFSDTPHVVLQENFWHAAVGASTTRFLVIHGQTGAVTSHALSNEAYTEDELAEALRSAGFRDAETFASLSGNTAADEEDLPVVVARR